MKKKNIIITGANRGLGLFLAERFAKEGHNIFLLSRKKIRSQKLKNTINYNQKVSYGKLDLESKKDILKISKQIKKKFKNVDILINNAAIQGPIGFFHKNNFLQWEKTIMVNLINTAFLIKNLIPILKKNKKSLVINISGGGSANSRKYFSSYSVAKTGLVRLTENLANEYKLEKINFFAIAPGILNTRMFKKSNIVEQNLNKSKKKVIFSDMERTFQLINFLSNKNLNISGKLISAIWDKWKNKNFIKSFILHENKLTLRRQIK